MQDLRLVGVHDDGEHLLLSGAGGEMFQLPIDEALRGQPAGRRPRPPPSRPPHRLPCPRAISRRGSAAARRRQRWRSSPGFRWQKSSATRVPCSLSASTLPSRPARWKLPPPPPATTCTVRCSVTTRRRSATWWPTGSVHTASKPRLWSGTPGGAPMAAGMLWHASRPSPAALSESVRNRRPCGRSARPGNPCRTRTAGRSSSANWSPSTDRSPRAGSRPSRTAPLILRPTPMLPHAATAQLQVVQQLKQEQEQESDGLLDMLRSRRGQRLGVDEDADDALAKLLTSSVPAAHPRPSEVLAEVPAGLEGDDQDSNGQDRVEAGSGHDLLRRRSRHAGPAAEAAETETGPASDPWERRRDGRPSIMSRLTLAPRHEDGPDDALKLHDGVSTETTGNHHCGVAVAARRPAGSHNQPGARRAPGRRDLAAPAA